jgi:hypothetical protein
MKRFELQDHGEPRRLAQFVPDDMAGDFRREREWKSHKLSGLSELIGRFRRKRWSAGRRRRGGFQKEHCGRNRAASVDAATPGGIYRNRHQHCQPQKIPI